MPEKLDTNGKKLEAGEYVKGRKGGKGFWSSVWDSLAGKPRERWTWVIPPKGYIVVDGNIVKDTMPDPKAFSGTSQAGHIQRTMGLDD